MKTPRVPRLSVLLFSLAAVAGLVMSARSLLAPSSMYGALSTASGHDVDALAASSAESAAIVRFVVRYLGTQYLGVDSFGLVIALVWFRRGDRWAWWAMTYWPVMFAMHFAMYRPGSPFYVLQVVNFALSVVALGASARAVRPFGGTAAQTVARSGATS